MSLSFVHENKERKERKNLTGLAGLSVKHTIILQRQRIKLTEMPRVGYEPLTLGVASSDEDH